MSSRRKGEILMVTCAVLWSVGGLFIKYMSWNPFLIAGLRSVISGLVVVVFMSARGLKFQFQRQAALSGLMICGTNLFFVVATKTTTAANAITLQYIAPAVVLIISAVFLHQKLKRVEVAVVAVTFFGIILFFLDKLERGALAGNLIAIASGFFFAGVFLVNGAIRDESTKMTGVFLSHVFLAMIGVPVGAIVGLPVFRAEDFLLLILLGIVQLGIPYIRCAEATSLISPLECSLIGMLEPIMNPIWVALFYGEIPGRFALLGGVIVITTVMLYTIWSEKQKPAD